MNYEAQRAYRIKFGLLISGHAVGRTGSAITTVALPLTAVLELQASPLQVSLITAAVWLPWLIIGLPSGAWADRLPPRAVLLGASLLSAVTLFVVPLTHWLSGLTVPILMAVAVVAGCCNVMFESSYQKLFPALFEGAGLQRVNAAIHGTESVAYMLGPVIAGLLTQVISPAATILFDALSFLFAALTLALLPSVAVATQSETKRTSILQEIKEGLAFLIHDPYLRVLTAYGAVANAALTGYQTLVVVFVIRTLHLSSVVAGLLVASMSAGGVIGALLSRWADRRLGNARAFLVLQIASTPAAVLVAVAAPGWRTVMACVAVALVGAGIVGGNIIKDVWRQTYCPPWLLGRILAGMQVLNYGAIPLGAVAAGILAQGYGIRVGVLAMTILLALSGAVLLIGPLKRDRIFPMYPDADAHSVSTVRRDL